MGSPICFIVTADSKGDEGDAYRHLLRWKGAIFTRQLAIRSSRHRPDLRPLFENLESVNFQLSILARREPAPNTRRQWERQITELTDRKEALEHELSSKSVEFRQEQALLDLQPDQLKGVLPARSALIDVLEYAHWSPPSAGKGPGNSERRLVAFVVRRDRPIVRVNLSPSTLLSGAVTDWRRTYGAAGASNPSADLRRLIWKPLEPYLDGADPIFFSPDGPLSFLPLSALPGAKLDTYLVEARNIVVIPIPRFLPQLLAGARSQSAVGAPLLIGDINFAGEPGIAPLARSDTALTDRPRSAARGADGTAALFPLLPGTAREVNEIGAIYARQFGGQTPRLFTGSQATEEAFREEGPKHRWVHVATHGFFAPETVRSALDRPANDDDRLSGTLSGEPDGVRGFHPGLLSGIVFSGANGDRRSSNKAVLSSKKERGDGILTALEVEGLDLGSLELLVLSACETGLGKTAGGEGVLGLQRAFQLAGAKTCITSLWKVDDAATQVLMTEFYTNLWQKKFGKLEALRQAQLRMLREYDPQQRTFASRGLDISSDQANGPKRGSPFYWAAFVLSGDWR